MKKVSIIIPTFNGGLFIKESVISVINLYYPEKEIIIIDDKSTDEYTIQVLKELESSGFVDKVIWGELNQGPSCRNRAIEEATGDFILPLDDDDTFEPEFLSLAVREIEKDSLISPVYCDTKHTGRLNYNDIRPEWSKETLRQGPFIVSASLFRKSAWEKIGGYESSMKGWEDYDFWWRMAKAGYIGKRVPGLFFNYRHIKEKSVNDQTTNKESELYNYIMNKP